MNTVSDFVERAPRPALYAVLALVSIAIYGQSVGFELIWDSHNLVFNNEGIRSFEPLAAFVTPTKIDAENVIQIEYYRPVLRLLFSGWYKIAGESSALWHGLAVAVNIVAVILAFRLMRALAQPRWAAFAIALLFAVNPGRVAGVTLVYGLSNQFFGIFVLAAFLFWVAEARAWSLLFAALALGCRETAVLFPVVILAWELLFRRRQEAWGWLAAQLGLVVCYLVVRQLVVGSVGLTTLAPVAWLNSVVVILSSHLHSVVWPGWGVRYYPAEDFSGFSARVLAGYGVLLTGIAALAWGLRQNRWVAFWLLWFGIWISIHFNVGRFGEFLMDEKNNYLLALSFAVLFVAAAQASRKYALLLCASAVVLHGGLATWRVTHWRDSISFFTSAAANAPHYARMHFNLGLAYFRAKNLPQAEAAFRKTVEVAPDHSNAWNSLGHILYSRQDLAGATRAWLRAFQVNPNNFMAAYNLSIAYKRMGDMETAARYREQYQRLKAAQEKTAD